MGSSSRKTSENPNEEQEVKEKEKEKHSTPFFDVYGPDVLLFPFSLAVVLLPHCFAFDLHSFVVRCDFRFVACLGISCI